jgi:hypothetical protein
MLKYFFFLLIFIFLSCSGLKVNDISCIKGSECPNDYICVNQKCELIINANCSEDENCKDGEYCINKKCVFEPCNNNGDIIIENDESYSCKCDDEYSGRYCSIPINEIICSKGDDCPENAVCINDYCELRVNAKCVNDENCKEGGYCIHEECIFEPCSNHGDFIVEVERYSCNCDGGYYGNYCNITPWDGDINKLCADEKKFGDNCESEVIQWGDSTINELGKVVLSDTEGNIFVIGEIKYALDENNNQKTDIFITKFDKDNNKLWTKFVGKDGIGTDGIENVNGGYIDNQNNIYLTGSTNRVFTTDEETSLTGFLGDIFVAKLNSNGIVLWIKQFGTLSLDVGKKITLDKDKNIYVIGETSGELNGIINKGNDIVFIKLKNDGSILDVKLLDYENDEYASNMLINNNDLYIVGSSGNFGDKSIDVALFKTDLSGNLIFKKKYGTDGENDIPSALLMNHDTIYIGGITNGAFEGLINHGEADLFLININQNGEILSKKLYGTPNSEYSSGLFFIENDIYIPCSKMEELAGYTNKGPYLTTDICLFNIKKDTQEIEYFQRGTDKTDTPKSSIIINGYLYITGETSGNFYPSVDNQGKDAFLLKLKLK